MAKTTRRERVTKAQVEILVPIQSLSPSTYKYLGYVWRGAGSIVFVEESDVDLILAKRKPSRSCCGGSGNVDDRIFRRM